MGAATEPVLADKVLVVSARQYISAMVSAVTRRPALIAVVLLGLAGLAGWWRAVSVRDATRARWERVLHLNASVTAEAIEEWVRDREEDAATLAVSAASTSSAFTAPGSSAAPHSAASAQKLLRQLLTASRHRPPLYGRVGGHPRGRGRCRVGQRRLADSCRGWTWRGTSPEVAHVGFGDRSVSARTRSRSRW